MNTSLAVGLRRSGLAFAAAGAVLFSAKAILAKYQYRLGMDALDVMTLRMLLALPLFALLALRQRLSGPGPRLQARERWTLLWIGLLGYYLSSLLDFWGLQYIPVSLERLILFTSPGFVLLLGALFWGRRVAARHWAVLGLAYAGVALVMLEGLRLEGSDILFGSALVLGAAISYALYLLLSGELIQRLGTARLVSLAMAISTAATLAHYLALRPLERLLEWPADAYALAFANAFFCTFLPVTFTLAAVRRIGSGDAAQVSVLGPVSLVFLGAWLLDEPVTLLQIAGTCVVLWAMWRLARA